METTNVIEWAEMMRFWCPICFALTVACCPNATRNKKTKQNKKSCWFSSDFLFLGCNGEGINAKRYRWRKQGKGAWMSPMGRRPTWPAGRKNSFEFSFFLHICLPIAPALQLWQAASHKEIHRADEILYCQKEKGRPLTLCLVFYALFFRLPPRV